MARWLFAMLLPGTLALPLAAEDRTVLRSLEVRSQIDGVIDFIGTELRPNDMSEAHDKEVWAHPRTKKKYKRLRVGDAVEMGQVLVFLDDWSAWLEFRRTETAHSFARKEEVCAQELLRFAHHLLDVEHQRASADRTNLNNAQATMVRYIAELGVKQSVVSSTAGEQEKALVRLRLHEIRSSISGRVDKILKQPGEVIKAGEAILQLR